MDYESTWPEFCWRSSENIHTYNNDEGLFQGSHGGDAFTLPTLGLKIEQPALTESCTSIHITIILFPPRIEK